MLFCTKQYLIFFAIIFFVYWVMPWRRARVLLLLAASMYFYASWNKWLALLICCSTMVDYWLARGIEAHESPGRRRFFMLLSLAQNLCVLIYFKYANFFLDSLRDSLNAAGMSASFPVLSVILPIGISFYTFEAISYTIDVYKRRIPAEKNLFNFMLFILFFPHLIAGPIVRGSHFLPQVARAKQWNWARIQLGTRYVILGVFKKMVIADRMAAFADPAFSAPGSFSTVALWLAALAYALQVYCDFSGYSDIAIGCAHLLGYKLSQNFNMPYLAKNIADFWRRWHISLSTWLKDYLFIPLGGSRGSVWFVCRNLIITMTLAGLWHGASWNFVVFGVVHGVWLSLHRVSRDALKPYAGYRRMLETTLGTVLRVASTFAVFMLTLCIFRTQSLGDAWLMLGRMLSLCEGLALPLPLLGFWITIAIVVAAHLLGQRIVWHRFAQRVPAPVQGLGYACILTFALLMAPDASKAFIYFQF